MSLKSRFFVGRLQKNCGMKENDYPNIDEERGLDLPHWIMGSVLLIMAALDVPADSLMYLQTKYNIQTAARTRCCLTY